MKNKEELLNYLEELYSKFNKKEFIKTDPLMVLYNYSKKEDIEIVGLIASSLAYGRVSQILKAINIILAKMQESPFYYLKNSSSQQIIEDFKDFKYRFTTGSDISNLLIAMKITGERYNTLENLFLENYIEDSNIIDGISPFIEKLLNYSNSSSNYLIPSPKNGSACKRFFLFLRWMVRNDDIDFGLWSKVNPSDILIPLDTHIYKIAQDFKFTERKSPNLKTVIEITNQFKAINPNDPVKYDFALTRAGIITTNDFGVI